MTLENICIRLESETNWASIEPESRYTPFDVECFFFAHPQVKLLPTTLAFLCRVSVDRSICPPSTYIGHPKQPPRASLLRLHDSLPLIFDPNKLLQRRSCDHISLCKCVRADLQAARRDDRRQRAGARDGFRERREEERGGAHKGRERQGRAVLHVTFAKINLWCILLFCSPDYLPQRTTCFLPISSLPPHPCAFRDW